MGRRTIIFLSSKYAQKSMPIPDWSAAPVDPRVKNVENQVLQNAVQNPGVLNAGNQNGLIVVAGIAPPIANRNGNGNTQLLIAQKEEAGIRLQSEEFDLMDVVGDIDEIKDVNENCEEQYSELLEPISEPHQIQHNDNIVIPDASIVELSGGTVDQNPTTTEEIRAHFESLYNNLATKVKRINMVNRKIRETNANLTTELARYKKKHDPPVVYDSEETLQLAQESRLKMKQLNKEIKPENYAKINKLSEVFVSQKAKSHEQVYFSNTSKTANVSKSFSIPDEESSDDTSSVAQKFLNEVKDTLVTLQRFVNHRMNGNITNLSSSTHQEIHKIFKDEIVPIVNQVDSKVLEIKNERLLRAVFSQDIMSIVQNKSVVDTSDLHTELDHTKQKLESCIIKKEIKYATLWNDMAFKNFIYAKTDEDLSFLPKDPSPDFGTGSLITNLISAQQVAIALAMHWFAPENRVIQKPASPSKKKTLVTVEESAKKPATRRQSAGVQIRDTPRDLDVSKADSFESEYESWKDSDDDNDDDDQQINDERTKSDDDGKAADINKADDEEENEFIHTLDDYVPTDDEDVDDEEFELINKEMYSDVNVALKDSEHEGEGKDDEVMKDVDHKEVSQEVAEATTSTITATDSTTLTAMHQRLSDVENEVKTLRNVNHNSAICVPVKSKVLTVVKEYLGTNVTNMLQQQQKSQKSTADIHKIKMEQAGKQQELKYTIISSNHKALYHALMKSILADEDAMDKDQGLKSKKRGKETEPSKKAKSLELPKSPPSLSQNLLARLVQETIRPPTPDPEWNEGKSVENKPTQKWLSDLAKAEKPSKTFDDLMSTPIDFGAFVMNRLQISDRYPFNLSKPLPLIKSRNSQIVLVDYFFNNDLAYLQGENTGRTYTTSLTKIKAAKYFKLGTQKTKTLRFRGLVTLQSVWDTIHDMATNLRMGYNKAMPKRIWTHLDKIRSHIMIKEIDRQLQERRLMRSLEKFICGRHYEEDLRLLQQTI
ncbi:hypothetical protein Tco_1343209 [Tanacetum coccineum]